MTIDELDKIYNNMSVYGDTYNTAPSFDGEFKEKILPVDTSIPIVKQLGTPYNNNDNKIAANNNIDYNNLIIPSFKSEQESNMFTDAINKFKSFGDNNKLVSGILKAGSFIKDPITGAITSLLGMLPEQDPRATATRDFYGDNFGLTSSGSVASGIMKDYNPVSGGGLYTLTGGKFGEEPNYGLGRAIDKRIERIQKTIAAKTAKYGGTYDPTYQIEKIKKLQAVRAKEAEALKETQEKIQQQKDDKIAQQLAQEKIFAAQGKSDPNDQSRTGSSGRRPGSGGNVERRDSGPDRNTDSGSTTYDSGGREGFGYGLKDGGRIRYGKGGIVSL